MVRKYNQQFDFTPFLRQDVPTANRGGAIADIFKAVADTNDGYGENADAKLLGNLADEINKKNILKDAFYNSENAITAGKIVDGNIDRANQLEQVARNDSAYHRGIFTENAKNDALTMDKAEWDAKYSNAGGFDGGVIHDVFTKKEDRVYTLDQRQKKAQADALALKQAKAAEARRIAKYNYDMKVRKQNEEKEKIQLEQSNIDKKFMYAFEGGYIPSSELENYRESVSPEIYNGIVKQQKLNNITNKYSSLEAFKNSEDWKTTPLDIKNEVFKMKIYDQPKSTYQEKLEQDYIKDVGEISSKLSTDDLTNVDYDEALKNKIITQNDLTSYKYKLAKSPSAKEVDKKMISGDFSVINQKANQFSKAFNNPNLDTGVFENNIQKAKSYLPDLFISKDDLANADFRSSFNGFAATLLKIQSGATVTDKERAVFYESLGTLNKNKKINAVGILDKLSEAEARYEAVKTSSPEYFNIKYGSGLRNLKKSKSEIESFLFGNQADNKPKTIGKDIFKNKKEEQVTTKTTGLTADDIRKGNF